MASKEQQVSPHQPEVTRLLRIEVVVGFLPTVIRARRRYMPVSGRSTMSESGLTEGHDDRVVAPVRWDMWR